MSTFFFYLLLIFMLLFGGYETTTMPPDPTPPIGVPPASVPLGAEFSLGWGNAAAVGDAGLVVTFDMIASNGRCPEGMECAASNPVAVALTVREPGSAPAHIVLSGHTDGDGTVAPFTGGVVVSDTVLGHVITLLKVAPYPRAGDVTPKGDYAVALRVDSLPGAGEQHETRATLDTPFVLAPHESIDVAGTGMQIEVTSIVDTRCPVDLECGATSRNGVEVGLRVSDTDGKDQQLKLVGRTDYAGIVLPPSAEMQPQIAIGDYTLALQRVAPLPGQHRRDRGARLSDDNGRQQARARR